MYNAGQHAKHFVQQIGAQQRGVAGGVVGRRDFYQTAADQGEALAPAEVVARGARVLELPLGGSALGGSSSAVILVSLPEADALRVVSSMRDGLTPVIRSR